MSIQESTEKAYFEQLICGQFIDVKDTQNQWRLARIVDRDHKFILISYDGFNFKDEQVFAHSFRVAPLRANTEGYTGSAYKPYRQKLVSIADLKIHSELLNKYLNWQDLSAFQITQYLRGDLFVTIHTLLTTDHSNIPHEDSLAIMKFLSNYINWLSTFSLKIIEKQQQYFETVAGAHKFSYLSNATIAAFQSMNQLTNLLILILKIDNSKHITIFKNKDINHEKITTFFISRSSNMISLLNVNDGCGRWLPFPTRRNLLKIKKYFCFQSVPPKYKIRDFQEIFLVSPILIQEIDHEQEYIQWLMTFLKEQSPFEAKLKSIQQLKKILDSQIKLATYDEKKLFEKFIQQNLVDSLLHENNFNGEIFKRFVPVLKESSKYKILTQKHISTLFRLAQCRHEFQKGLIYEIICLIAQFCPSEILDYIFTDLCKLEMNHEQTLIFIKNFTINAVMNYSKQKHMFSSLISFFRKVKANTSDGYYGLPMLYRNVQDGGKISEEHVSLTLGLIKQMFLNTAFHSQRQSYLQKCINLMQKKQSFGQNIKLLTEILLTFPSSSFISDDRKIILERLDLRTPLIPLIIGGIRQMKNYQKSKINSSLTLKYFFQFLQNFAQFLRNSLKVEHIEFLWMQEQTKMLCEFLKKTREDFSVSVNRRKYQKRLDIDLIRDIVTKIPNSKTFFARQVTFEEFLALDQLFLVYHYHKLNIDISEKGFIRYLNYSQLEGSDFYYRFMKKLVLTPHFEYITRKIIEIFLRPKDPLLIDNKVKVWKEVFLKIVDTLKEHPEQCLRAINYFLQMMEGRMEKDIVGGNLQIMVKNEGVEKILSMAKNQTLFKLRKTIMSLFEIEGDFTMVAAEITRPINFLEEEDFCVSVLPVRDRYAIMNIVDKKKGKHCHLQAVGQFRKQIQKCEQFYQTLFSLIDKHDIRELFWKTVQLLPVNSLMVRKIQSCENYSQKEWRQLMNYESPEGLQYCLNILYDLMDRNKVWNSQFILTGGLSAIQHYLNFYLDSAQENFVIDTKILSIANRLLQIIIRAVATVDKDLFKPQQFQSQNQALTEKINLWFNKEIMQSIENQKSRVMQISLLNNIFELLLKNGKQLKLSASRCLELETIRHLLRYGLFVGRCKETLLFAEDKFLNYVCICYPQMKTKRIFLDCLLDWLELPFLLTQPSCELYVQFLIDFMNSFIEEELLIIYQETPFLERSKQFLYGVLTSDLCDPSRHQYSPLIYGSLKLLCFILNSKHSFDPQELFGLINNYLFKLGTKRVKHEKTFKILYQIIKKLLFTHEPLCDLFAEVICPQLARGAWRKNKLSSWSIQSQKQEKSIFCGLQNLGATCYINCLFQQLFMLEIFRDNFLQVDSIGYRPSLKENEIYQLQSIFATLKYSNKRAVNTRRFCDSFRTYEGLPINPLVQSDADQFFNALMEKNEDFLNSKHRHDILEETFGGKLANQLNCEGCPHNSEKVQPFKSIGLNIRNKKTLEQALQAYVEGEILDGDNAYFCEICNKKVKTLKRLCIKDLPNVLVIVLKRFQFNYDEMRKTKINNYLSYPEQLSMLPYMKDGSKEESGYFLRGVVIHSGTSEGGHYYSFIKQGAKWFIFNDEQIEESSFRRIEEDGFGGEEKDTEGELKFQKHRNAYILLYERTKWIPHRRVQQPTEQIELVLSKQREETEQDQPVENDRETAVQESILTEKVEDITETFEEHLRKEISTDNANADFLAVMLDTSFVRLIENISSLNVLSAKKTLLIYFHTVFLRDRMKEDHILNYLRIIFLILKSSSEISLWYLNQANLDFIREFCIQAPRMIRFIMVSLLRLAIRAVDSVPDLFINQAISALSSKGMTPFAKIFKEDAFKVALQKISYPRRAYCILNETPITLPSIEVEKGPSEFGSDSSLKPKQRQFCPTSLCESLGTFPDSITYDEALKLFEKFHSREGIKSLAYVMATNTSMEELEIRLRYIQNRLSVGMFKLQEAEKYLFLIRQICCSKVDCQNKMDACIGSLKLVMQNIKDYYDSMDLFVKEIVKIAKRAPLFEQKWRNGLQKSPELIKILKYWLKQVEKPYLINRAEQYKRKTSTMSYSEKNAFQSQTRQTQQKRINWMIKEGEKFSDICSDLDDESYQGDLHIRSRKFKIKEHFGLVKRVEVDKNERWGILERNEFDIIANF